MNTVLVSINCDGGIKKGLGNQNHPATSNNMNLFIKRSKRIWIGYNEHLFKNNCFDKFKMLKLIYISI